MISKELERDLEGSGDSLIWGTNEDTDKNHEPLSEWYYPRLDPTHVHPKPKSETLPPDPLRLIRVVLYLLKWILALVNEKLFGLVD
jgi:hypothetical protein